MTKDRLVALLCEIMDVVERELDALEYEDELPDEDFDLFLSDELGVHD